MNSFIKLTIITLIVLASTLLNAHAENMKKMGNMNIHYIALNASFITPEIAKNYDIFRSKYNGLINISVLDNTLASTPAKTVSITGTARNLAGQDKKVEFVEVKEGDAIYYLAQVNFRNEETIVFDLTISDSKESHQLKFSQKFYVD
ncbi:DUF4426 domain-containing protein [Colwellia sp. 1_MG-2023]|uniref:DUF4426 domain-containing protein n=1 Tax=Colwellia sp. 1_MG-2023 TaxID=3062649 RepID=UPI0026E18DA1|nr:DUF4426 domain-containing protein [Colwellia sp. 1_MG-2023]MDO6445856.1 DUF4426 domain-containing protein [Colwellia sp. 1_MG-2023]